MKPAQLQIRIGLFVLAVVALFVASLFFFGLADLFQQRLRCVSFFDESVRGLEEGSKVRYRGVEIGQVEAVLLGFPADKAKGRIPVVYSINQTRLNNKLGLDTNFFNASKYEEAVQKGLRAQLENESILTGQLFVNLNYDSPKGEPAPTPVQYQGRYWIPSTPSTLEDVTKTAVKVAEELGNIDYGKIGSNFEELLKNLNGLVGSLDPGEANKELLSVLQSLNSFLQSGDLEKTFQAVEKASTEIGSLADGLNKESEALAPEVRTTLQDLSTTLQSLGSLSDELRAMGTEPDGPVSNASETLRELRETLRSLDRFLEMLQRHPNALLFGKEGP